VNLKRLKGSDPVLVHQRRRTVHEVNNIGETCCGNGLGGKGNFLPMTRSQAQGLAGSRPCESLACVAARR
jgi:hypothetical protein